MNNPQNSTVEPQSGRLRYIPVDRVVLHSEPNNPHQVNQQALSLYQEGVKLFAAGRIEQARLYFEQVSHLASHVSGAFYAQAVCLARMGQFETAANLLQQELSSPSPLPKAQTLLADIQAWRTKRQPLPHPQISSQPVPTTLTQKTTKTVLSIVVTSRHDDHGGNLLHRMQAFINGLVYQCQKFNLPAELIIVEWNPSPDKKKLASVLQWPQPLAPLTVRFIEVPPEQHRQIGNADKIPLFQMIAKNVGIRRARGDFVLATNIDILFSDELIWFLAQGLLDTNCFYRIDRYDVGRQTIPLELPFEQQLAFCQRNLIRIQGLNGTVPVTNSKQYTVSPSTTEEFLKQSPLQIASLLKMGEGQKLHDNACGDFTLMAREKWFALRAYPEMPLWSIHLDTIFLNLASVIGLQQVILPNPMRIYHIEHEMGWAVIQDTVKERPSLDWYRDILPWCQRISQEKRVLTPNHEEWGFAQTLLDESVVVSR